MTKSKKFILEDGRLIDACRSNDKKTIAALLDENFPLTPNDKRYLAKFLRGSFRRGKGHPRNEDNRHVAIIAKTVIKPMLTKILKEEQRKLRKEGLRYGLENKIITSAMEYAAAEGLNVTESGVRRHYRRKAT